MAAKIERERSVTCDNCGEQIPWSAGKPMNPDDWEDIRLKAAAEMGYEIFECPRCSNIMCASILFD